MKEVWWLIPQCSGLGDSSQLKYAVDLDDVIWLLCDLEIFADNLDPVWRPMDVDFQYLPDCDSSWTSTAATETSTNARLDEDLYFLLANSLIDTLTSLKVARCIAQTPWLSQNGDASSPGSGRESSEVFFVHRVN